MSSKHKAPNQAPAAKQVASLMPSSAGERIALAGAISAGTIALILTALVPHGSQVTSLPLASAISGILSGTLLVAHLLLRLRRKRIARRLLTEQIKDILVAKS